MAARVKSANKTKPTRVSPASFLAKVTPDARRQDALALTALMEKLSGEKPVMWGPTMVGFGSYTYRHDSGREGEIFRLGFSPRKPALVLYINDFPNRGALLAKLGPVTTGASCIYVKKLDALDHKVLAQMVRQSLAHLKKSNPEK